jgi:hypothetical protein
VNAELICRRVVRSVRPRDPGPCPECDSPVDEMGFWDCSWCGAVRDREDVATIDVVVTLANGNRLLVTSRWDDAGGWTPVFARPGTEARIAAWRRLAARNAWRWS